MIKKLLFFYILLLIFTDVSISQEHELNNLYIIVDRGSLLQNEIIHGIPGNYDVNGKLAAGLLVVSNLSGLEYFANNGMWEKVQRLKSSKIIIEVIL